MRYLSSIFIFLFFLATKISYSQKQGNNWYFGDSAGISFNSGAPLGISGSQTYLGDGHNEGTSSISDCSGTLFFYSNGEKVWNRYNQVMPNGNGLLGHYSSTQSSLIVPQPGSDSIFYLLTTDSYYINNLTNGLRYSKIDMSLDGGLGDIIIGEKNIFLLDSVSEKLTVVKHFNNVDYWIITHKYYSDKFYAYKLTSAGIDAPIVSAIGSMHEDNCTPISLSPTCAAIGYMKVSPNGAKLVLVNLNTCNNLKELFDFDNSSGVVSNFIDLELLTDTFGGYGISFSPDNSKLYFTDTKNVFQYNLTAGGGNPLSIRNSKTQISSFTYFTDDASNALQIGPDGKIYVARPGKPFLAVINNPNQPGMACNFADNAVSLNGRNCNMGLPNLIDSYNYHNTSVQCETELLIPNVFTPNNDGINDLFTIEGLKKNNGIQIYNRWGTLIFETQNEKTFWNGNTNKGQPCENGIYYYIITLQELAIRKGFVQILK